MTNRMKRIGQVIDWCREDPGLAEMIGGLVHAPHPQMMEYPLSDDILGEILNGVSSGTSPVQEAGQEHHEPEQMVLTAQHRTNRNVGFQARALRFLSTGSAKCEELREVLGIPKHEFGKNIANMVSRGHVVRKGDLLTLTEEGRQQAMLFLANLNLKVSPRPKGNNNAPNRTN